MKSLTERSQLFLIMACLGLIAVPATSAHPQALDQQTPVAPQPDTASAPNACEDLARSLREDTGAFTSRTVVVVTVPDPIETRLSMLFDEVIEAVTAAAIAADFLPGRHDLPWVPTGSASHTAGADACKVEPRDPHTTPGILEFRREGAKGSADQLTILLVGESPLYGIHRVALEHALQLSRALSSEATRRIIGPYFSGSAPGLQAVLGSRQAAIITGTATGPLTALRAQHLKRTVADDESMWRFLTHTIAPDGGSSQAIAVLTERGTEYGRGFGTETTIDSVKASEYGAQPLGQTSDGPRVLAPPYKVFHFPLHIASARAADEQTRVQASTRDNGLDLRRTLKLKLETSVQSSDTVPVFGSLTPFEAELSLRNTLRSIAASNVRYLVIAATDPVDLIYLVRQARAYCPDIQLVTFGASTLYAHPDLSSDLSGLLVFASYPMSSYGQDWQAYLDDQRHVPHAAYASFTSDGQEGVYNALATHLLDAYGVSRTLDYAAPGRRDDTQPIQWLLMLDSGKFWPVFVNTPNQQSGDPVPLSPWKWARPTTLALVWLTLLALGGALQVVVIRQTRRGRWRRLYFLRVFTEQRRGSARAFYCVTCLTWALVGGCAACCAWQIYDMRGHLRFDSQRPALWGRALE